MSQPRDTASKGLADLDPVGFVKMVMHLMGREIQGGVSTLDSDLKSANFTADRIFRIDEAKPWLLLVELLGYTDDGIEGRLDCYSGYAGYKYGLPAQTVLVLLSRSADKPRLSGYCERRLPGNQQSDGLPYRTFRYNVIRLWEIPIEELLNVPISMLPFAVLGKCNQKAFPGVISRMVERIEQDATPAEAAELWTYTRLLVGVRFSKEVIAKMFPDYSIFKESSTFKEIIQIGVDRGRDQGRREQALHTFLTLGRKRFGEPPAEIQTALSMTSDPDVLESLTCRIIDAKGWFDLMPPEPQ